ncbi:hypothetical protein T439DRAFT_74720 [Meredithblackwellia eburnea MCA 4105]
MDVRTALADALAANGESQRVLLARLTSAFSGDPQLTKALYPTITSIVTESRDAQPLNWAASILELALRKVDARPALAPQSLSAIARLLSSSDLKLEKLGLECFASIYPLLFRQASQGNEQHFWATVISLKTGALRLWRTGGTGAKTAAIKVLQRIIQSQTRGTADPRLQRTAEPNLSQVRPNHPFLRTASLEEEATKLLEECITSLFTSDVPDVVAGITTSLVALVKLRPAFLQLVVTALTNWTPAGMAKCSPTQVRSVEKAVRISVHHLLKTIPATPIEPYRRSIDEFLSRQAIRMESAYTEAKSQREREMTRKRQLIADEINDSVKRRKIEDDQPKPQQPLQQTAVQLQPGPGEQLQDDVGKRAFAEVAESFNTPQTLASVDATSLPLQEVVDAIVATLQGQSDIALTTRIDDARRTIADFTGTPLPAQPAPSGTHDVGLEAAKSEVELDPLKVDLGDDDKMDEELRANESAALAAKDRVEDESDDEPDQSALAFGMLDTNDSDYVSSTTLSSSAKTYLIESAIKRICTAGTEGAAPAVWVPLVSRLITRGFRPEMDEGEGASDDLREKSERREGLRRIMFDFVVEDMQNRLDFARLWLNEEWWVDDNKAKEAAERPYDRWLRKLLEHILEHSSNKDRAFTQFIVDLPSIPSEEVAKFGIMCTNPEQVHLGFSALRELVAMRPTARQAAVDVLLGLAVHPDKLTRNAAINTLKRWVPDIPSLSEKILAFSVLVLRRLETAPPPPPPPKPERDADDMADSDDEEEEEPKPRLEALVKDGEVIDGLPPAETESAVLQHIELLFALSVKQPDLLKHLFEGFSRLQQFAQDEIINHITPLIKTLGTTSPKILSIISECPQGSEPLILKLLTIIADMGRLPKDVTKLVRGVAARRDDLGPRFLIMVIGDCDKEEMYKYIPRIVTVLNNTPEEKLIVRSVFLSILAPASLSFAATANTVRQRHELLTPVELMVLLHNSEKEMGLKQTIEAISICFSMSDSFRPEILAAFMTQIVDGPSIPVLFLRTVIQAVTTYKTLQPFVSTTLLSKLIQKEVWTTAPLWEGFIRCAKTIQPHSFGALLQLPKEQLEDFIVKQPSMKAPLREYAIKKSGNSNKNAAALEVLGTEVAPDEKEEEEGEEGSIPA